MAGGPAIDQAPAAKAMEIGTDMWREAQGTDPRDKLRVAGIVVRRRRRLVERPKVLVAGPRLEQRAIHGEMLMGENVVLVGQGQHLLEERLRDVSLQIVVELLHELALAPNGVQRL